MTRSALALAVIAAVQTFLSLPARAEGLSGQWVTEDGSSQIRFEVCGARTCGRIVWLKDPIDPATGREIEDKNNPDEQKRRTRLLGLVIFKNLAASAGTWGGDVYNPDDGNTYSVKIRALADGRLEVKGCALMGIFCQSEVWTSAAK